MFDETNFGNTQGETHEIDRKSIVKDMKSDLKHLRNTIGDTPEERLNYVIVTYFFVL